MARCSVLEIGGGERGAHAGALALLARAVVDAPVGLAHALGQPLLGAQAVRQLVLEGLDGDPRGDLAGLRAAHAVGDHEQRGAGKRAVLVVAALAAGIGLAGDLGGAEHHCW